MFPEYALEDVSQEKHSWPLSGRRGASGGSLITGTQEFNSRSGRNMATRVEPSHNDGEDDGANTKAWTVLRRCQENDVFK